MLLTAVIGALPLLTGACEMEQELLPAEPGEVEGPGEAAGALEDGFRAWTDYVSEEDPPLTCPNRYAAVGFDCTGSYCDNVALYCEYVGGAVGHSRWKRYFSEEGSGSTDEGHCTGSARWITGVACSGSYCDNLSVRCTKFPGTSTGDCNWSDSYSEEEPRFFAPPGFFIKGIACNGSYCDNKRYRYCRMN